jgi:hypothetical protein
VSRIAVLNEDDESFVIIKRELNKTILKKPKIITYGSKKNSDINPIDFKYKSKLIGDFYHYPVFF